MQYRGFRTLVVYEHWNWCYDWLNKFCKKYNSAIAHIEAIDRNCTIMLLDGSSITSVYKGLVFGYRADRIYLEPFMNLSEEEDTHIKLSLVSWQIREDVYDD